MIKSLWLAIIFAICSAALISEAAENPFAPSSHDEELYTPAKETDPDLSPSAAGAKAKQPTENQHTKAHEDSWARGREDSRTRVGNLSARYIIRNSARLSETAIQVVVPENTIKAVLQALGVGEVLQAEIPHSIMAFTDDKVPVIARITSGELSGWRLIGESVLEKNSKRIIITFHTIAHGTTGYKFRAIAAGLDGKEGLEGEYHSNEGWLMTGDFLASLTAAYFDGLVPRQTNPWGQVTADNSVDSAFKRGVAGGAMSSAERFREKLRRSPEWSEARGPLDVRIMVLEKAVEW